jgi:3-dehydroquinate dehydratase-2
MKILLVNGPNLNLLGRREPRFYGSRTYQELVDYVGALAEKHDLEIECRQSNSEGTLIDWIQESEEEFDGLIINAAGYSHTSIAIMDALKAIDLPVVEVHLTDFTKREEFRHKSYVSLAALNTFSGKGFDSYAQGIIWLKEHLQRKEKGIEDISIRPYEEKDWPHLQRIYDSGRNSELRRCGYQEGFAPLDQVFEKERLFESEIMVLLYEGVPRGFIAYQPREITWFYVEASHQNKGFGQRLLYYALQHTKRPLNVWLLHGNRLAIEMYKRVGFAWAEERKAQLKCQHGRTIQVMALRYTLIS